MNKLTFRVSAEEEELRIDRFLAAASGDLTRSYIQKLIKEDLLHVNGKPVKASYVIREDDEIVLSVPDPVELDLKPVEMDLDIVYEDDDVLVVNKPAGMVVHPAPGHYEDTLVNGLMYHCRDRLSSINGVLRPGIVHRIDKDTSGLLVVCKNDTAHGAIAGQLKEHSVTRIYKGICCGNVKDDEGRIDIPIGRDMRDRKRMAVNGVSPRQAVTNYRVLERFKGYTYMEFRLETGRTHQIRVHMASKGHPLMGDEKYNAPSNKYGVHGQMLHAGVIGFIHPSTGKYMEFEAGLPDDFVKVLDKLRNSSR